MDAVDIEILTNGRAFGQNWQARRKRLKELAEMRRLLPPSDKEAELTLLGMMVWSKEQTETVAALAERGDFYTDELGRLFDEWKAVVNEPRTSEARKAVGRQLVANGVSKVQADEETIVAACSNLRELRRQRRIDIAAEEIYLAHEQPDWVAVTQRELEAVKGIRLVPVKEKVAEKITDKAAEKAKAP